MRRSNHDEGMNPIRVKRGFPSGNRGALLVGLVVAMVIFAILGAALLPINATSTMNLIGSNSSLKAYYLAESGYRYAGSQFAHAGSTEKAKDDKLEALHDQTFTLADNGGNFYLEIFPWYFKTVAGSTATTLLAKIPGGFPATGRTIPASGKLKVGSAVYPYSSFSRTGSNVTFMMGASMSPVPAEDIAILPVASASPTTLTRDGNLTLISGVEAFPAYIGTFRIGTDNTVYTYRKKNGSVLEGVAMFDSPQQAFSTTVANGADVACLKYLEIRSTGSVGGGMFSTARRVNYSGPIATAAGDQGGAASETVPDLADIAATGGESTGTFETTTLGGDTALHVEQTTGGSGSGNQPSTEAYISLPPGASNPIYQSWNKAGSFLSYDAQVKIATGDWSADHFINKPETYCAGLTFRASPLSNQSTYYGLSLMRTHAGSGSSADGIADSMLPPVSPPAATTWASGTSYTVGDIAIRSDDYYQCIVAHTSSNSNRPPDASYWLALSYSNADKAMVVFWTRNGNAGDGDDNWLAYKLLDETAGSDYVVDSDGKTKDWSTLAVRVVEAASLRFNSSATQFQAGETVVGTTSGASGVVFRKIQTSGGVQEVILLNNVTGTFTPGEQVSSPSQTAIAHAEYRPRDNYIWAFYTDVGDHSSDAAAVNNVHLGQARGSMNWPLTEVSSWSAAEDKFVLVQWNAGINTAQDAALLIMGSGKEANAIVRTNQWTTEGYSSENFPPELGIVSLGGSSVKTYFDDLAFYLRGAADAGGGAIGFLPPVQQ